MFDVLNFIVFVFYRRVCLFVCPSFARPSDNMEQLYSYSTDFNVLLTAHLGVNLVNDQLDAQFFYFIIRLLQPSTCFEQRRAHHQDVKLY